MEHGHEGGGAVDHALLIDCTTSEVTPYPAPADVVEVIVIHTGQERALSASAYAKRTVQCSQAEAAIGGPLRTASLGDIDAIADPVVRARATHVMSENARVRAFASALGLASGARPRP